MTYDLDPMILCAAVHLPAGAALDWVAAELRVLRERDAARLSEDLQIAREALEGAPGFYNCHELPLAGGRTWVATKVEAEPDEHDTGAYFALLRLSGCGALEAAG